MAKFIKIPFATAGDKTPIPDALQIDGSVSYTTGFGEDYSKNAQTSVVCQLTGVAGTMIPAGSSVVRNNAGYAFELLSPVILDPLGNGTGTFQSKITGHILCPPGSVVTIVYGVPGWNTVNNTGSEIFDSTAKKVPRFSTNQALFDLSDNINQYQTHGFPRFITTAENGGTPYPYDAFAIVRYDNSVTDENYESLVNSNTTDPTNTLTWRKIHEISSPFITGEMKFGSFDITLSYPGWIIADFGTIGSVGSNALIRANADTFDLYSLYWNTTTAAICPMFTSAQAPTTRGVSADADFNADKGLRIPIFPGRAVGMTGFGTGLTPRVMGETYGVETVSLTAANNGPHTHSTGPFLDANAAGPFAGLPAGLATILQSKVSGTSGTGAAHENIPPTLYVNALIKL